MRSNYEIERDAQHQREREQLESRRRRESGPYTGRCPICGSADLWDDNHACGCNRCSWMHIEQI